MNSFLIKIIRYLMVVIFGAFLMIPQESYGMAAFRGFFKNFFRDVKLGETLTRSIDRSLDQGLEKSFGRALESAKAFKPEGLGKAAAEATTRFQSAVDAASKKIESFKPSEKLTTELQEKFQTQFEGTVKPEDVLDRVKTEADNLLRKDLDDATKALEKDADQLVKDANAKIEQAEKLKQTDLKQADDLRNEAAQLNKDAKALSEQVDHMKSQRVQEEIGFKEWKAQVKTDFDAMMKAKSAVGKAENLSDEANEEAANKKAGAKPGAEPEEKLILTKGPKAFATWGINIFLGGLGFSMWNWVQARIEQTQAHVAMLASARLPQYFGGMWYAIPDRFINGADPMHSVGIYAPVVREIHPANFKSEGATSKFAGAGTAAFFGISDETVLTDLNNAFFGRDNADDVLDMHNLFVTAGANRGNYCGQLGWGGTMMVDPYFGRRMLHVPTGYEFFSTGQPIDPKYPMRQLFGDSLGISNCDTSVEPYIAGTLAGDVEAGASATVTYNMFTGSGSFQGTGGSAGIDLDKAKEFVEKYILQPDNKTLLDIISKIDYVSGPSALYTSDNTPRGRLAAATASYGSLTLSQVTEISASDWQNVFGVNVKRPKGLSIPQALSGYGFCIYQTADTPYIKNVQKAIAHKRNITLEQAKAIVVDYVIPLMGIGIEVAPAIIPVIHGAARAAETPGWITWETNPRIKYLYSLVSGHRYNAVTGVEENFSEKSTAGSTIESSTLVAGALKDSAGQDTLLSVQKDAIKGLLTASYTGTFVWGNYTLERLPFIKGTNDPYVYRVANKDEAGKPSLTTLPIANGAYLDDYVVPVNANLEAVEISSANLMYFVSLVTSKIYDISFAEVSEQVPFTVAHKKPTDTDPSSDATLFWGDQKMSADYADYQPVPNHGQTALGTLFTDWSVNPYNQDKLSIGYIYSALLSAFNNKISKNSTEIFAQLNANKAIKTAVLQALAVHVLNAMRSAGLTLGLINNIIQKPTDTDVSTPEKAKKYREAAIELVKGFAANFANIIVDKIINIFDAQKPSVPQSLQSLVGKDNPLTWQMVWQQAAANKISVDFDGLALTLFQTIDDTTWNNALGNIANYRTKAGSNWVQNPNQKTVTMFNNIGDELTTPGIYDFYSSLGNDGLIPLGKMYLYLNSEPLSTVAGTSTGKLATVIQWPDKIDQVIKSNDAYYNYLKASKSGIVSLIGPFAFSQRQIPNVLITAISENIPVYTSSDYPGDYFIVTNDIPADVTGPVFVKEVKSFDILKPQKYLVSLFSGNIYERDDTTGAITQKWVKGKENVTPARISNFAALRTSLSLPGDILASLDEKNKKGNWFVYAGRRLYLDPRDDKKGLYLYQDISSIQDMPAWEKAKDAARANGTDYFTGVSDFLIGFLTDETDASAKTASGVYGASLSAMPNLVSLVTGINYTSTGQPTVYGPDTRGKSIIQFIEEDVLAPLNLDLKRFETTIIKSQSKAKEEKAKKPVETQPIKLAAMDTLKTTTQEFPFAPFSNLYMIGKDFYGLMKDSAGIIIGYTYYNYPATSDACGIGYYDETGTFLAALFGDDAKHVRMIQGLYGTGCNLTLGVPQMIPAIRWNEPKTEVPGSVTLAIGTDAGESGFKYDGIYPGTYKLYQTTYPITTPKKGTKQGAVGRGVVAEYTPQISTGETYYVDMSSGNVFKNTPSADGAYQPVIANYPVLTATDSTGAIISIAHDLLGNPRVFATTGDGYYYDAAYDELINDKATNEAGQRVIETIKTEGNNFSAYRFNTANTGFNVSLVGTSGLPYLNSNASNNAPIYVLPLVTTDSGDIVGQKSDDTTKVTAGTLVSYARDNAQTMRHYQYLGSTKLNQFGTTPVDFTSAFANQANALPQLAQYNTGLFVQGTAGKQFGVSSFFVPALMADVTSTTLSANGFVQCTKSTENYYETKLAKLTGAQFKYYEKTQKSGDQTINYVVIVCKTTDADNKDTIQAHYYMPMYQMMDMLTRNSVEDAIDLYPVINAYGDNILVKAITPSLLKSVETIVAVPASLEANMQSLITGKAFANEHKGSYAYDEKTKKIIPSADFTNRYLYQLSSEDLSDKKPSYFVGQPVAQYIDLYAGILFAPRTASDKKLRPVGNLSFMDLTALLTAKGVRPPDPFDDVSLYRPFSETVYNPATKQTEEKYVESAVGPNGRLSIPTNGLPEKTPFMYCVAPVTLAPAIDTDKSSSGDKKSSSTSSSSEDIGSLWETPDSTATTTA